VIETRVIQAVAAVAFLGGIFLLVYTFANEPQPEFDRYGVRGLRRRQAMARGGMFTTFEPLIRWLGARLTWIPLGGIRHRMDTMLVRSGDWLGVSADELLSISILSALAMAVAGGLITTVGDLPGLFLFFFAGLGAVLPYVTVTGRAAARQKEIDRGLPPAIDLAALCMGAGLDFTATLRQLAQKSGRPDDALVEEIEVILGHLLLGVSRQRALRSFADRVPTDAVRQFVTAVIQSEEKGNPLSETLKLQAETLRLRRSVRGEEAASRAAVMMMLPLVFILCSILLVVMGPFVVRGYLGM
jgi:tight adherence protein C